MLISIISTFYNEEENINFFYEQIKSQIEKKNRKYEFIFINDSSTDKSKELVNKICEKDRNVKLINTSRKFGFQECIYAGMQYMTGDVAIIMDTDLQDPPEMIEKMINCHDQGYEVVNSRRIKRDGESYIKLLLTKYAYKIINLFSEIKLTENSGIFKLFTKKVVKIILSTNDHDPYLRGMFNWVGFRQITLDYDRNSRQRGESKFKVFSTLNPWKEVVRAITSFSMVPLYLPLVIGFIISTFSFVLIIYFLLQKFFIGDVTSGWTSLILTVLFLGGLILVILGIIGIYIGKMFEILRGRPKYIIESTTNIIKKDD